MSTATSRTEDPSEDEPEDSAAHLARSLREEQVKDDRRLQMVVLTFYLVDAALVGGYALLGFAPLVVPFVYAATGLVMTAVFIPAIRTEWYASLRNSGAVVIQTCVALVLILGVALAAPPLAMFMLMTGVSVIASAAMRLPGHSTLAMALLAAGASLFMLQMLEGNIAIPLDTWPQRALAAAFVLWTLIKTASTNVVASQIRIQLTESHKELAKAMARVEKLAWRDELSALPNRRRILAILESERARMVRSGVSFSVCILDLDHFKQINDTFGHAVGDAVLRASSKLIDSSLRKNDSVGRYGGDEFLLVLPGPASQDGINTLGERIRRMVEQHDWGSIAPGLAVTVSLGLALAQPDETTEHLLERADGYLYNAKAGGRNRVATG